MFLLPSNGQRTFAVELMPIACFRRHFACSACAPSTALHFRRCVDVDRVPLCEALLLPYCFLCFPGVDSALSSLC